MIKSKASSEELSFPDANGAMALCSYYNGIQERLLTFVKSLKEKNEEEKRTKAPLKDKTDKLKRLR